MIVVRHPPDHERGGRAEPAQARPSAKTFAHNELDPAYLTEVVGRLEAAAGLLTGAQAGRIESGDAEIGAIRLIDGALLRIEIRRQELLLAESRWAA